MQRIKKTASIAIAVLCLACSIALSACSFEINKTPGKLTSDGIVVEGGEFGKGAELVTDIVDASDKEGQSVIALIEDKEYDKKGEVRIFDISVVKDGSKVQPSGKVKVTVPAPFESESGYVTFHIKDDNSVQDLKTTYANGKIFFEL